MLCLFYYVRCLAEMHCGSLLLAKMYAYTLQPSLSLSPGEEDYYFQSVRRVFKAKEQFLFACFSDTLWDTEFVDLWNSDEHKDYLEDKTVEFYSDYVARQEQAKQQKFGGKKNASAKPAPKKAVPNYLSMAQQSFKTYFQHRYDVSVLAEQFPAHAKIVDQCKQFETGKINKRDFLNSVITIAKDAKDTTESFKVDKCSLISCYTLYTHNERTDDRQNSSIKSERKIVYSQKAPCFMPVSVFYKTSEYHSQFDVSMGFFETSRDMPAASHIFNYGDDLDSTPDKMWRFIEALGITVEDVKEWRKNEHESDGNEPDEGLEGSESEDGSEDEEGDEDQGDSKDDKDEVSGSGSGSGSGSEEDEGEEYSVRSSTALLMLLQDMMIITHDEDLAYELPARWAK